MIKHIFSKLHAFFSPEAIAHRRLLSIKLREGDIVIDCGANIGNITELFNHSKPTIYCFEPNPYAFKVLQKRFSNSPNVHCIPNAVGIENTKMKLYFHENSDQGEVEWSEGSSLLSFKGNVLKSKHMDVEVTDLCEFIASLRHRVRILKMDVEGFECTILKNMIDTNTITTIDHIFVEMHDHKIPELVNEGNFIRDIIKKRNIKNINLNWG